MQKKEHKITQIIPGSIADQLGIQPDDVLLSVNGTEIEDVFDYRYQLNEEFLTVAVRKPDGEEWEYEIEKEYGDDLGMEFGSGLMDGYRTCSNKCIFCFIDQMPPGMRDTLYFKDDDSRLSFLQGNYVTLTNMKDQDIERIITYKLAPINISVHTMDGGLRCKMLNNRFAGGALEKMRRLYEAGIEMNGQIVLCKGVNDKGELERSIRELTGYIPHMQSLSIVPAGLTKYRSGLYPLEPFTAQDAREVLEMVHKWQDYCMGKWGTHFVHAADEWYLLAGEELPPGERYDGYIQLENGVGMMRLLLDEFREALEDKTGGMLPGMETPASARPEEVPAAARPEKMPAAVSSARPVKISIATGKLAAPFLEELAQEFMRRFPEREINVFAIRNDFFGEQITVSGLLTGQDLLSQLRGQDLGGRLLLPCNMLRSGEEIFLDDMPLHELEKALQVKIVIVNSNGQDLYEALL